MVAYGTAYPYSMLNKKREERERERERKGEKEKKKGGGGGGGGRGGEGIAEFIFRNREDCKGVCLFAARPYHVLGLDQYY